MYIANNKKINNKKQAVMASSHLGYASWEVPHIQVHMHGRLNITPISLTQLNCSCTIHAKSLINK